MSRLTARINNIVKRNEGRKWSGCKAKWYNSVPAIGMSFDTPMGIDNLSTSITIGETTKEANAYYLARDAVINNVANTCSWPSSVNPQATSTINVYSNRGTDNVVTGFKDPLSFDEDLIYIPGGSATDSVYITSLQSTSPLSIDKDTEATTYNDFIYEFSGIFLCDEGTLWSLGNLYYDGSYHWADGIRVYFNATGNLCIRIQQPQSPYTALTLTSSKVCTGEAYYHFMIVADRDGYLNFYANGVSFGRFDMTSLAEKLVYCNSGNFYIGGFNAPGVDFDDASTWYVSHFGFWRGDGLVSSDELTMNEFALSRHADLVQCLPQLFNGTQLPEVI